MFTMYDWCTWMKLLLNEQRKSAETFLLRATLSPVTSMASHIFLSDRCLKNPTSAVFTMRISPVGSITMNEDSRFVSCITGFSSCTAFVSYSRRNLEITISNSFLSIGFRRKSKALFLKAFIMYLLSRVKHHPHSPRNVVRYFRQQFHAIHFRQFYV